MPRAGGESDKLGNRYEATWTVGQLLHLLTSKLQSLVVEPFGDDSRGVEFVVVARSGRREFHSVKRQRAAGDWTLSELCRAEGGGRSVLSDLSEKLAADPAAGVCFVSSTGANQLRELAERAKRRASPSEFQSDLASSDALRGPLEQRLLPLAGDWDTLHGWLRRLRVVLMDEDSLTLEVERQIDVLLYRPDAQTREPQDVRLLLADYVLSNLGVQLTGSAVWDFLNSKGYVHRSWAADTPVYKQLAEVNRMYIRNVELELINNARIERNATSTVLEKLQDPEGARHVVLAAAAGVGKSCVVAQLIDLLAVREIPCAVVRVDQHGDARTTREIGRQLDLPSSPAVVLAGIAEGKPCVLLVDQMDALSQVSGRYPHLWDVFAVLLKEAGECENMRLVVACREFDLQHDPRLRAFARDREGLCKIPLELLTVDEVQAVLQTAGVARQLSSRELEILRTPLHLLLFLDPGSEGPAFGSASELYDRFWERKQGAVTAQVGGPSEWAEALERLCDCMSDRQVLAVPEAVLDKWPQTVAAMKSQHVLIAERGLVRFFHESFFDYAFARRFCADGRHLVDLLRSGEQHLFRRGQVRQVLHYRRGHDRAEYLREIPTLLRDDAIRFHVKKLMFQWMGSLEDPTEIEWRLLEALLEDVALQSHVLVPIRNSLPWFDLLVRLGIFDRWLASDDDRTVNRALWMIYLPQVQEHRSAQAAAMLAPYCGKSADWNRRLRHLFRRQDAYRSPEMQDLFLQLLDLDVWEADGDERHGEDWWDCLHEAADASPAFVVEAIAHWLDLEIAKAREVGSEEVLDLGNHSHSGEQAILAAANGAPLEFARSLLPRYREIVQMTVLPETDKLQADRTWLWRSFGSVMGTTEALQVGLVSALSALALTAAADFERLTNPLHDTVSESETYVLLKSWSANPAVYGEVCIDFLAENPHRLGVGYASWSGEGTGQAAVSRDAIEKCRSYASEDICRRLEHAVLAFAGLDDADSEDDGRRVWIQRLLLEAVGEGNLSDEGRARLSALREKFPEQDTAIPTRRELASFVGSPVSAAELETYSDDQWLAAMRKYDYGWEERRGRIDQGSAVELSRMLDPQAGRNRPRFAALVDKMEDSIRTEYFDAILEGICGRMNIPAEEREADQKGFEAFDTAIILAVIRRLHRLPNCPCGRSICHAFEAIADRPIPEADLDLLAYYAVDDPDPKDDWWMQQYVDRGADSFGENGHFHGYNSVRGTAACAISAQLFADYTRSEKLLPVIEQMTADKSLAVRSCVFETLLPILNHDRDRAVALFVRACEGADAVLDCRPFEDFIRYASSTHYAQLRPVLQQALHATSSASATAAARQICLAAFGSEEAEKDAVKVRHGSTAMRKGAADIYSHNLAVLSVADQCAKFLPELFQDESLEVRDQAGSCFFNFADADFENYRDLLQAYIESPAFPSQHDDVLRRLEESTWQLPDVIIRLAERFLDVCGAEAGDLSKAAAGDAPTVTKLVMRLYSQSRDDAVRSHCLDLIDEMERLNFLGIDRELMEHDR
ncbi:MAG: hypothetical protein WD851_02050 [Pirellulales bacterium]